MMPRYVIERFRETKYANEWLIKMSSQGYKLVSMQPFSYGGSQHSMSGDGCYIIMELGEEEEYLTR